ncbi:MAG: hypothetical protein M1467_04340 [Deltaproteobacteria bacterium]|nr:hypothetical protein [Deltaproteobacteria bacterium]
MNCAMSGGCAAYDSKEGVNEVKSIDIQLRSKGICERGDYSIYPVDKGDFRLFAVKYDNCPAAKVFDDEFEAIREFLKLTN